MSGCHMSPKQLPGLGQKLNTLPGFLSLPFKSKYSLQLETSLVFPSQLGSPRSQGLCVICICNRNNLG